MNNLLGECPLANPLLLLAWQDQIFSGIYVPKGTVTNLNSWGKLVAPLFRAWFLWLKVGVGHIQAILKISGHKSEFCIKGAQVWDFSSFRFLWFLWHKVSIGRWLEGWNKKSIFLKCGPDTYHFIFASVCAAYAGNDFWLWVSAEKKVVSDPPEVHLNVSK